DQAPPAAAVPPHRRLLRHRHAEPRRFRHRRMEIDDRRQRAAAHRGRSSARQPRRRRRHSSGSRRAHLSRTGTASMNLKNTPQHWGSVSKTLHWLIALLILALGIVGLLMGELPKTPKYFWVYTAHKSLGITVLALVALRLGWRLYAGAPEPV